MVYYEFLQRQIDHYRNYINDKESEERRLVLSQQREEQYQEKLEDQKKYQLQLGVEKQQKKIEYETKQRHRHIKNKRGHR